MLLPEFFDFILSTARAFGGLGVVFAGVAVGRWTYSNPQPTWKETWRAMPGLLRTLSVGLVTLFLVAHVVLTIREFSGDEEGVVKMAQAPKETEAVADEADGDGVETAAASDGEQVAVSPE